MNRIFSLYELAYKKETCLQPSGLNSLRIQNDLFVISLHSITELCQSLSLGAGHLQHVTFNLMF